MLKKFKLKGIACLVAASVLLFSPSLTFAASQGPAADGTIMYSQDFESNTDGLKNSPSTLPADRVTRVTDPLGQRGTVLKTTWKSGDDYRTSDTTQPRTEIDAGAGYSWPKGQVISEAWGQYASILQLNCCLAQNIGDSGPYWMLHSEGSDGQLVFAINGDTSYPLNYYIKTNAWTDFKVEFKSTDTDGYIYLWINGTLVFSKTGFAFTRASDTIRFKGGIYNTAEGTADNLTKSVYISNISLGLVSGSNLALNKTATASSQWSSTYAPSNAVDGSTSTRWASASGTSAGQWLKVDLGSNVAYNKVVVKETSYANVTSFKIQSSNDGTTFTDVASGTTIGSSKTITFSNVTSRYVRLYVVSASDEANINEFEVYAQ